MALSDEQSVQSVSRAIAALRSAATPQSVPSGILDDAPLFPPIKLDAPLTKLDWNEVYFRLRRNALPFAQPMADLKQVDAVADKYRRAGVVPIAVGRYRYHAVADDLATLEEHAAFFAGPLARTEYDIFFPRNPRHRGLNVRYVMPSELYLTNTSEAKPSSLTVDFGDGKGPREVAFDQPIAVDYPDQGRKNVTVAAGATSSTFALDLLPQTTSAPPPDMFWSSLADSTYGSGTGHAWVYLGAGHTQLTNPVLVAEGFPGNYQLDQLWEILDASNLATSIIDGGRDLVIVGFDNGTSTSLEDNAAVIIAAMNQASAALPSGTQLVVGGASMGGLITRYALTLLESKGVSTNTSLYFSFDSPHYGATLPLGVAYALCFFNGANSAATEAWELVSSTAAQELLIASVTSLTDPVAAPSSLRTNFVTNLANLGDYPSCRKIGVSNGVSTGIGNGTATGVEAIASQTHFGIVVADVYSAPGDASQSNLIFHGRLGANTTTNAFPTDSPFTGSPALDSAPGGNSPFFGTLASDLGTPITSNSIATFIPAISALALNQLSPYNETDLYTNVSSGQTSDLDAWIADTQNDPHVTVTPAIAAWLLQQLGISSDAAAQAKTRATQPRPTA